MEKGERRTVMHIIDSTYRGGAQKVVLEIVHCFPEMKHVVCYWSGSGDLDGELEKAGATLLKMPFHGMATLVSAVSFIRQMVSKYHVDILHTHMFTPNLISWFIGNASIRKVRTYHGECFERKGLKGLVLRLIERVTIREAHEVLAVSNHVKQYLQRKLQLSGPIRVVYNFGRVANKRRAGTFSTPLKFVATSNNQPYKNYPLLVEVFASLQDIPVTLDIFGKDMEPLIGLAQQRGATRINFRGSVDDVPSVLADYDVYLAASDSGEGFSLSLLEAMNAGLPVVCSDIPQFKEALADSGIFFRNRNSSDLRNIIGKIVAEPSALDGYSQKIRQRTGQFSRERFISEMRCVYQV